MVCRHRAVSSTCTRSLSQGAKALLWGSTCHGACTEQQCPTLAWGRHPAMGSTQPWGSHRACTSHRHLPSCEAPTQYPPSHGAPTCPWACTHPEGTHPANGSHSLPM